MPETGMHKLEVLRTATQNSARVLKEDRLGLVHPAYLADLLVVGGNPAKNLRYLRLAPIAQWVAWRED